MSFEDDKCKGFPHHEVAMVWWKKHMFLGLQSGTTMEHSNVDMYLKALMNKDISGPALVRFRDKDWTAGIETGDSCFNFGPTDELCRFRDKDWIAGIDSGESCFNVGPAYELCINYE